MRLPAQCESQTLCSALCHRVHVPSVAPWLVDTGIELRPGRHPPEADRMPDEMRCSRPLPTASELAADSWHRSRRLHKAQVRPRMVNACDVEQQVDAGLRDGDSSSVSMYPHARLPTAPSSGCRPDKPSPSVSWPQLGMRHLMKNHCCYPECERVLESHTCPLMFCPGRKQSDDQSRTCRTIAPFHSFFVLSL